MVYNINVKNFLHIWNKYQIISQKNRKECVIMKKLAKYLRPYARESILSPTFKVLEVIFDLLVPIVIAKMIDSGAANNDKGYIVWCFVILIAMAAIGLSCTVLAQFFAAKASVGFSANLRQAVFDHIQSLSFTELDTLGTDTLINRLTDDVNQVQNGVNMTLRLLIRSPLIVFGSMIMAFTINVKCALVFAVTIPILFVVVYLIMIISIPLFGKVQEGLDRVTALTRENLTGVRVIRAFCREEHSVDEFERSNRGLTALNEFVGRVSALLNPLTYVLINLAAVFLIHRCGLQINLGKMQQGEAVALYNYMLQMIVELIKLASLIITINKALACAKRVSAVLDVKTSMEYPSESAISSEQSEYAVSFKNVTFSYKGAGAPSLYNISFDAKKGQTVGIIGGTGSGKSTLVNLITRFYDANDGEIEIDGKNIKDYTKKALCDKIGIVQQKSLLFKGSVRDNLKIGNENATDDELWAALATAQAKEVIESKPGKLDYELEQNGANLSGGQKQRLSIARTLVKKPEILILDDSSSALDFATDAALRGAIKKLDGDIVTFIVSQRIAGIRHADMILVLDNGRLCDKGSHDQLIKSSETYKEIYYSQFPEEKPSDN